MPRGPSSEQRELPVSMLPIVPIATTLICIRQQPCEWN